ncbi:MAG: tetratricopeptide repeat protein [Hyphomicrobiales bacterium]
MAAHLAKHQKMTKRQMKEDPLVTAAFRATEVWEQHGRTILIVAGAVVLVGLLVFFVLRTRSQAEEKARGDLFRAMITLQQGDYATAGPMLKELIDNAPGTGSARDALLMLGDASMGQKNPAEAATWYQKYIDKVGGDRVMARAGYLGLGTAYEDAGEFVKAADAYAKAAELGTSDNQRGRAMLSEARSLTRAGQVDKAIDLYRKIVALPTAEIPVHDAANMHLGELQMERSNPAAN